MRWSEFQQIMPMFDKVSEEEKMAWYFSSSLSFHSLIVLNVHSNGIHCQSARRRPRTSNWGVASCNIIKKVFDVSAHGNSPTNTKKLVVQSFTLLQCIANIKHTWSISISLKTASWLEFQFKQFAYYH